MKNKFIIITFALFVICISNLIVSAQNADKLAIDKFISDQATRAHGAEYPDARKVLTGDLNGDGAAETVVLTPSKARTAATITRSIWSSSSAPTAGSFTSRTLQPAARAIATSNSIQSATG